MKTTALALALLVTASLPVMAQTATPSVTLTKKGADSAQFLRDANRSLNLLGGWLASTETQYDARSGETQTRIVFNFRDPLASQSFVPTLSLSSPATPGVPFTFYCDNAISGGRICTVGVFGSVYTCVLHDGVATFCVEH